MTTKDPELYKRLVERERKARKMAESILEKKSSELYALSQELQKSNDKLQSLIYQKNTELQGVFENLVDAYVVIDVEGHVLKMNDAAVALLEYDPTKEPVFLPALVLPEEQELVAEAFKGLLKKGSITNFKVSVRTKTGAIRRVHINASTIVDENNKAIVAQGIVRDITDEERKARIIDEQKRQLEFIVNNSPLGIALTTDGIIEKCNASFTRILGYPEDRIIGKDLKSITIAAEQSDYEEKRKDLHKGAFDSFVTTQKYITSSGQIITTKINVSAVRNHDNHTRTQEVITVEDVTKELLAREQLVESENRLSALISRLQSGVLLENEDRAIVLTNQMFCDMFGIPVKPEHMQGLDCSNAAEENKHLFKNPEQFVSRITQIVAERQLVTGDELELLDGRIFERDFVPIFSNGQYKGHLWSYTDVTVTRRYKNDLQQQKEKYSNIIANMNLGLLEVDTEDRILLANQSFSEISGYDSSELIGKKAAEVFMKPSDAVQVLKKNDLREKGISDSYEIEVFNKAGEKRNWLISGAPNFDINGKLVGSIGIHLDITTLKDLEAQKESLLNTLEKSNRELQEYAHVVSHDLKSPLRSINALASWIKEDNLEHLDEQSLENFSILENTLEKMEGLISGILNYSSIQRENIQDEEVSIKEVIEDIETLLYIPEHIELIVPDDLPIVNVDRTRIQQVFQNLISNAIRYSNKEKGLIRIHYTEEATRHVFAVEDNGMGIDKIYHDKIFKIFQSLTDHKESTGIGLSIVKKIVDLYDGSVWLESEPNEGCTFYFSLKKDAHEN